MFLFATEANSRAKMPRFSRATMADGIRLMR